MGDDPIKEEDSDTDEARAPKQDAFLQALLGIVESAPISFDLTLQVAGLLVSGRLVSTKDYFEAFGRSFSEALPEELASTRQSFEEMFAKTGELPSRRDFIHLKDARVFHPGGKPIPGNRGVPWRGRTSKVDAFWLGTLQFS